MDKTNFYLFGLCILFVGLKLIAILTTNFNLYGDEAQYWQWSKELSFGYYSKPPLLSWFIRLITFVFGDFLTQFISFIRTGHPSIFFI